MRCHTGLIYFHKESVCVCVCVTLVLMYFIVYDVIVVKIIVFLQQKLLFAEIMDAGSRKDKPKQKETSVRGDRAKPKSAQQELKQRQRAEVTLTLKFIKPAFR